MKKLILSVGLLLGGASMLSVQAATTALIQEAKESGSAKRMETIKSVCKTTPEQNTKMQALFNDYNAAESASKNANKGNPAALKEATKKNNGDLAGKLAKVLTPEQNKMLKEHDMSAAKGMEKK